MHMMEKWCYLNKGDANYIEIEIIEIEMRCYIDICIIRRQCLNTSDTNYKEKNSTNVKLIHSVIPKG